MDTLKWRRLFFSVFQPYKSLHRYQHPPHLLNVPSPLTCTMVSPISELCCPSSSGSATDNSFRKMRDGMPDIRNVSCISQLAFHPVCFFICPCPGLCCPFPKGVKVGGVNTSRQALGLARWSIAFESWVGVEFSEGE